MSQLNLAEFSTSNNHFFHRFLYYFKPMMLPILVAIIPTLYHYGNNVEKLTLLNLSRMLLFNVVLAIIFYLVLLVFHRFQPIKAAHATFVFLIFFNIYGLAYRYLVDLDVIRMKHFTFLPLVLMCAVYTIMLLGSLKNSASVNIWKNLVLILGILVIYNIVNIVPAEIRRLNNERAASSVNEQADLPVNEESPDIYYIVFDEFVGFQAMREYWHYNEVDNFVNFLKGRGFFIAEESYGSSMDTLHQMASRLNYQEYPLEDEYIQTYFDDISDNRVMGYLKSQGYTTVVFDETNMSYPSAKPVHADYYYEYGSSAIPQKEAGSYGFYFDEFGELVIGNTMLYTMSDKFNSAHLVIAQHSSMIHFTVDHITGRDVPSPKFVYVHLILPHPPFAFSEDGSITDNDHFADWNYYLDNYKYSIKIATEMVNKILAEADPKNPPIIILQSDHGARNGLNHRNPRAILPNYPEKFATHIMYALIIPGYDYSSLTQDINPINTFPIVFNHLFNDNIPLLK
jgi:hypothetical protein